MQLASLSPADLAPIETAPISPGVPFGVCLLCTADGCFDIGHWDGEAWWSEDLDRRLRPVRWLLLESPP